MEESLWLDEPAPLGDWQRELRTSKGRKENASFLRKTAVSRRCASRRRYRCLCRVCGLQKSKEAILQENDPKKTFSSQRPREDGDLSRPRTLAKNREIRLSVVAPGLAFYAAECCRDACML
ncbi:UNVERIFIED_CONTAM: hypothetical protein HHA_449860 [Hammondia hammondi]|eukprot:XP_008882547.1 hypothetical protein HHA_449860 [Hammondia hammondi]